jgi:hypothetical protein
LLWSADPDVRHRGHRVCGRGGPVSGTAPIRGGPLKWKRNVADHTYMATVSDADLIQAQIEAIEDCVKTEHALFLYYCAERDGEVPTPEALNRAMRLALGPDAYDRVQELLTGNLDTPTFEGRFVMDNIRSRAEALWRLSRRPPAPRTPS